MYATMKFMLIFIFTAGIHGFAAAEESWLATQDTTGSSEKATFNVKEFGARGDGTTLDTKAINEAISACAKSSKGTVLFPAGRYLSGTIILKSNVTIQIDNEATIVGTHDLGQYKSYILTEGDPDRPINITVRDSGGWCRALVLGDGVENVRITGSGTIDGSAVVDKQGEEGRRGPHGIFLGNAKHIVISGIRISRAGNYNIIGLDVEDCHFSKLTITEGSDGIHIRRGKDLVIEDCKFYTSDDAIAGGYWDNMKISDCLINSSCNGIRLILPASHLEIANCQISGPGVFGHHRGSKSNPLVYNSLAGIILQPGAWGIGPGKLEDVYIHDIRMRGLQTAFMFVLNEGNSGNNIRVNNLKASGITRNPCSVEAWTAGSSFTNLKLSNIDLSWELNDDANPTEATIARPRTEARSLPFWGIYFRNVNTMQLDSVFLTVNRNQAGKVFGFTEVKNAVFKDVRYSESGMSFKTFQWQ